MSDMLLMCESVSKSFGGLRALADVNLSVAPSEIVGLAGANGAGKSTLLGLIGGQARPDSGRIVFLKDDITHVKSHGVCHRGVARTFQDAKVFTSASVIANVALSAEYGARRGMPRLRYSQASLKAAMEALEQLSLSHRATDLAATLSVYERKRLMLACALVRKPTLLLLDEPAGGLSPKEVEETVEVCRAIRETGSSIVVVEHLMAFLTALVDRMCILHEGRNLCEGTPGEVSCDARVRAAWLGEIDFTEERQ